MFDLRAIGCTDESSWLEVLSPDVCVTMPITPYRHFNPVDVVNNKRVLLGINGKCGPRACMEACFARGLYYVEITAAALLPVSDPSLLWVAL